MLVRSRGKEYFIHNISYPKDMDKTCYQDALEFIERFNKHHPFNEKLRLIAVRTRLVKK